MERKAHLLVSNARKQPSPQPGVQASQTVVSKNPEIYPIILAAGGSQRLGFAKQDAKFDGHSALELAVRNCAWLRKPIVVLGCGAARLRRGMPPGVRVVVNRNWRRGMLSSFLAGLRRVPRDADFLLYPVDYPLLTETVVGRLVAGFCRRRHGQQIAVPSFLRRTGHPVVFAAGMRRELSQATSARQVVYRDRKRVLFVSARTAAIFRDFDTPAAYRKRLREFQRRRKRKGR